MSRRLVTSLDELYERVKDRYSAVEVLEVLKVDNPSFIDNHLRGLIKKKIRLFEDILEDDDYTIDKDFEDGVDFNGK